MGYPKEVYERAWSVLDNRRQQSRQILQDHQQEVKKKFPEIAEIQMKMIQTAAGITKAVVSNPNNAGSLVVQLGRENLELQKRRTQLLKEAGYPEDYLTEKYNCAKCSDTGYIGTKMCSCFESILKNQAFAQLNFVCDGNSCNFYNFRLDLYPVNPDVEGVIPRNRMSEIYDFAKEYASSFNKNSQSLLMMGKTGLGKTHLSLAIAAEVTAKGFGVVYTPVQKLMDKLESQKFSYSQESKEGYSQNINSVLECDLLLLDDLGTEFITSFTTSVLYNIVNTRLVEGRPTIINTNLEPGELESIYSQRMASRLGFGYKIIKFYGNDIRFLMRQQRHNKV